MPHQQSRETPSHDCPSVASSIVCPHLAYTGTLRDLCKVNTVAHSQLQGYTGSHLALYYMPLSYSQSLVTH